MNYLKHLIPYFRRYRKQFIIGFCVIFISAIFTNAIPLIISKAIDSLKSNITHTSIFNYAVLIITFAFISGIFLYFTRQTIIVVSRDIENDLRNDFLEAIQQQDQQYFHQHPTGDIMALATNDIAAVRNFCGPGIMYSSETLVNLILAVSLMISFNAELTLYALIPVPVISYLVYRIGKTINHKFEKVQEQFSSLTTKAQENISGIKVIKAYVREEGETESFKKLSADYMKKNLKLARIQSFAYPLMFMLTGFSVVVVLYFGGKKIIGGSMTLGELTAFIIYLGLLTWPIIALGWIVNITQRGNASMKRLLEIFNSKPEIDDRFVSVSSIKLWNEDPLVKRSQKILCSSVEFKNVSFRYSRELPYVLKNINLKIDCGITLGIIGHTGSGKSTLVNLIPRLYEVREGELLIDGSDIKQIPLAELRTSVGYVPQETFLFSDTIENNIAYGNEKLSKDEIILASKISQIYKDIDNFPKRFETMLGERGINLSGGQKQRTSIARAIAVNPRILILDDAFSAVDTYTEEEILNGLKEYMQNRTTILISHRISTLKNSDMIIVLKDGSIAESGTHESLIQQEGIYADIYFKQLLEEELKKL